MTIFRMRCCRVLWRNWSITLNEPKPLADYFMPDARAVFLVLFLPGFAAAAALEAVRLGRDFALRRKAKLEDPLHRPRLAARIHADRNRPAHAAGQGRLVIEGAVGLGGQAVGRGLGVAHGARLAFPGQIANPRSAATQGRWPSPVKARALDVISFR